MFDSSSNNSRDYYQVLGLRKNCSPADIKKQYHQLALRWHPVNITIFFTNWQDKNDHEQSKAKFATINEAYSVLGDQRKRKLYDQFGSIGLELDKECQNFANSEQGTLYSKRGFRGTDKSAFKILTVNVPMSVPLHKLIILISYDRAIS